jgi:hypothetical protein
MGSPTGLDHSRQLAAEGKQTEANPAELEIAIIRARTAADFAAIAMPHRKLLRAVEFGEFLCAGHGRFLDLNA